MTATDPDAIYDWDWPDECSEAARAEGWDIWDCRDSDTGHHWQIQAFDDAQALGYPELPNDNTAWRIVMTGNETHHIVARDFIRKHSPLEWAAMQTEVLT